jgi:hypothetical protein
MSQGNAGRSVILEAAGLKQRLVELSTLKIAQL